MKRIFIIQNTPLNAPLPLSVYLTDLLRNIPKQRDIELNLIIGKSASVPKEIKELCKKVYQFNGSTYSIKDNFNFSFYVNRILKEENKKRKIDIMHCIYPNSSLLGAVMFKRKNKNVKIVYDVRSPWIDMSVERGFINPRVAKLYKKTLYAEEKRLCKKVDQFIFITEGLKDYYTKKCKIRPNKRILITPSGIDTKKFRKVKTNVRKKYGVKSNETLIGSVGGIAKIRKLDTFLGIFKKVVSENKKVKLMFVGEGDALSDLKNKVKENRLEKNVIFVGSIPHSEVPKYLSSFDFGLCHLPNIFIYENSVPLKILEYLSCKVPVLASELKAHQEMSKKLNGVYVYKNASDILRFVRNNKGEVRTSLRGYDWKDIAKEYLNVWRK